MKGWLHFSIESNVHVPVVEVPSVELEVLSGGTCETHKIGCLPREVSEMMYQSTGLMGRVSKHVFHVL